MHEQRERIALDKHVPKRGQVRKHSDSAANVGETIARQRQPNEMHKSRRQRLNCCERTAGEREVLQERTRRQVSERLVATWLCRKSSVLKLTNWPIDSNETECIARQRQRVQAWQARASDAGISSIRLLSNINDSNSNVSLFASSASNSTRCTLLLLSTKLRTGWPTSADKFTTGT
jgi:hypothetical protein